MMEILKKTDFFGSDGVSLAVARRTAQDGWTRHKHEFSELVVVTHGSGLHIIKNEEYPIVTGDVFVVTAGSPHEYKNTKELTLVNVLYDPGDLGMSSWDVRALPGYHALFTLEPKYRRKHKFESRLRLSIEELADTSQLLDRLDDELNTRNPGFRLMSTSLFSELVVFLSRCYSHSPHNTSPSRSLLRIGEAISYLEDHYTESIDLETLAKIAHMSRRNFSRAFQTAMTRSPIDYLLHLRIAQADKLLKDADMNITEVAFQVGFNDSSYFARQYRKLTGRSPTQAKK